MRAFYRPWADMQSDRFDGFLITGAPVERMPFEEVGYWDELQRVLDWTQTHVHRTFTICWGAPPRIISTACRNMRSRRKHLASIDSAISYHHRLSCAAFQTISPSPYLAGRKREAAIFHMAAISPYWPDSDETGLCLVDDPQHRTLHMFNHIEYDSTSLAEEYVWDIENGMQPLSNYFPADDPQHQPKNRWRSHAHLLFGNWINEIYQTTP